MASNLKNIKTNVKSKKILMASHLQSLISASEIHRLKEEKLVALLVYYSFKRTAMSSLRRTSIATSKVS